jgi:hypothetical protein
VARSSGCRKYPQPSHPRDFPQRAEGVAGHPAGVAQHHRCATWRQRDRIGLIASAFGYAVTVGREQTSQDRSVQVPRFGPRRLKRRRRNAGWLVVHPGFTFILRVFPRSDDRNRHPCGSSTLRFFRFATGGRLARLFAVRLASKMPDREDWMGNEKEPKINGQEIR